MREKGDALSLPANWGCDFIICNSFLSMHYNDGMGSLS